MATADGNENAVPTDSESSLSENSIKLRKKKLGQVGSNDKTNEVMPTHLQTR